MPKARRRRRKSPALMSHGLLDVSALVQSWLKGETAASPRLHGFSVFIHSLTPEGKNSTPREAIGHRSTDSYGRLREGRRGGWGGGRKI